MAAHLARWGIIADDSAGQPLSATPPGALLLARAPRPLLRQGSQALRAGAWRLPLRQRAFRWLFAVLLVNGVAAAIPATLFLFVAGD